MEEYLVRMGVLTGGTGRTQTQRKVGQDWQRIEVGLGVGGSRTYPTSPHCNRVQDSPEQGEVMLGAGPWPVSVLILPVNMPRG